MSEVNATNSSGALFGGSKESSYSNGLEYTLTYAYSDDDLTIDISYSNGGSAKVTINDFSDGDFGLKFYLMHGGVWHGDTSTNLYTLHQELNSELTNNGAFEDIDTVDDLRPEEDNTQTGTAGNDIIGDFVGGAGASDTIHIEGYGVSSYAELQGLMVQWGTQHI